ncbi:MAG: tetratricopeptide repeat protein [Aggregatilineales bacterium]
MTEATPHEAPIRDINQLPLMHPGKPVGRDDSLKDIFNHLRAAQPVYLHAAPGTGKTTMAATLAAAYIQQPGGVLWLDARDKDFAGLLVSIGRAYHLSDVTHSETPAALVGTVTSALLQHRPFIVLDNINRPDDVALFVDKCLDKIPALLLAEENAEGNWQSVGLDALDDMSSVMLFKQKASITDGSHDMDIYGITKLLNYSPLAIVVAARSMFAAKQTPGAYLNTLKEIIARVNDDSLTGTLATAYQGLNNALQGLLLMLGATYRGEASTELLSMVGGVPISALDQPMTILSQLYLVEKYMQQGVPRVRLHPAVHEFMQNALRGRNQLVPLQEKVRDAIVTYAAQNSDNHLLLAQAFPNILATAEAGNREIANQLLMTLLKSDFVQDAGYVNEMLHLQRLGTGMTEPFAANPHVPSLESPQSSLQDFIEDDGYDFDGDEFEDDEVYDEYDDGSPEDVFAPVDALDAQDGMSSDTMPLDTQALHNIDVDSLRTALAQAKQSGDTPRQLQTLKAIGKVLVGQDKETEAISTYNEVLNLYETIGDDEGTLETLDMLSALLYRTDNHQAAIMHATRGVTMADERNDNITKMHLLMTMGQAREDLGESSGAVDAFSSALEIARLTDDGQHEALALYELGNAHLDNGDSNAAIHAWEQARELFKIQEKRDYEGRVLGGLGTAYGDMGRWTEAIQYYKSAFYIAREVRDREEEALQLGNLGLAQVEAGQLPEALLSYRQALYLAYESEQRDNISNATVDLVQLMQRSNRLLSICEMLVNDALDYAPNDADLTRLEDDIAQKISDASTRGITQAPVAGTAKEYAANAYELLDA